jgi:hypothetical protein
MTQNPTAPNEIHNRFKDSKIQRFKDSKIQRFKDSKIQRFKDSKIQRFKPRPHDLQTSKPPRPIHPLGSGGMAQTWELPFLLAHTDFGDVD